MRFLIFVVILVFSGHAWSIPLSTVGSVDNFLGSTALGNSGEAAEIAWVESVLGLTSGSTTLDFKEENNATNWELVDGETDIYAFALSSEPGAYLLKLGVGNTGSDTHYLFENLAELAWAVVDFSEMLAGQPLNFNFGRISHVAEFGVNEAPSFMLFGWVLGLLALRRSK